MNSRFFYWLFVIAWVALCWWWYVCNIKQVCGGARINQVVTTELPAEIVDDEIGVAPATVQAVTAEPLDVNAVQIEEVADKITIHYPFNKAKKEGDAKIDAYLAKLAKRLIGSGEHIIVSGHTDSVGNPQGNQDVSERRAKDIRDVLKSYGVSSENIKVEWFGEKQPKATNDTAEGRYANRRVEIVVQ